MSNKYDFSVNITVAEVKSILKIMEDTNEDVVGLHINNCAIIDTMRISTCGPGWKDIENHVDITDYESA